MAHCVKIVQIQSFSNPYFLVFGLNTGKYGPEKTPHLDTFQAVAASLSLFKNKNLRNVVTSH